MAGRPAAPSTSEHWSDMLCERDVSMDGAFGFAVEGGSDNGEFPFVGSLRNGTLGFGEGDILLEVQGQKVAGYTQRDVIAWLQHCCCNGNSVKIKAVKSGYLTKDLRQYLNARFQKGSLDHDLQNTIRDNLYLRTVPCTTRAPRNGEINGVDYTFLTVDEFTALERSGNLLESGIFEGNLYGTPRPAPTASALSTNLSNLTLPNSWAIKCNHYGAPKPSKDITHSPTRSYSSAAVTSNVVLPGAHATSEGKRRRNRSNVEAMASKASNTLEYISPMLPSHISQPGAMYSWQDSYPLQTEAKSSGYNNELPFGWERIDDPHYGTYYIDHVNRRTQYENPVFNSRAMLDDSLNKFNNCSSSWHCKVDRRSDNSRSSGLRSPDSDIRLSPRISRNSSLTQTTNGSNTHFLVQPNVNQESFDSNNNSNCQAPPPPPTSSLPSTANPLSSSPASTHRFPYLHCIPCLNEKHDPPKHPVDNSKTDNGGVMLNGNITSGMIVNKDTDADTSAKGSDVHCRGAESSTSQNSGNDTAHREYLQLSENKNSMQHVSNPHQHSIPFTRNPDELQGIFICTPLVKSARGFGFTIIGGDDPSANIFLQIKDVVPYGPAWCDGKLQTGDILVRVNNLCVLGYTHQEIISLFQSISPGEVVQFEVCRGYALPFDPNDPNTEIVTTVAVSQASAKIPECQNIYSTSNHENSIGAINTHPPESLTHASKSMPDLRSKRPDANHAFQHKNAGYCSPVFEFSGTAKNHVSYKSVTPEFFSVEIVKGTAGFGFTIADSAYGQKVKKILDKTRCKHLQEGDILTTINGIDVYNIQHTDVVQVLKDCPCGEIAKIGIQRGRFLSPIRNKGRLKVKSNDEISNGRCETTNSLSQHQLSMQLPLMTNTNEQKSVGSYRSKTPTAELYGSRDKEAVVIPRPKTPVVDAKNWLKTNSSSSSLHINDRFPDYTIDNISAKTKFDSRASDQTERPQLNSKVERKGDILQNSDQMWDWNTSNFSDSALKQNQQALGMSEDFWEDNYHSPYYNTNQMQENGHNFVDFNSSNESKESYHRSHMHKEDGFKLSEWSSAMHDNNFIQQYRKAHALNTNTYPSYSTQDFSLASTNYTQSAKLNMNSMSWNNNGTKVSQPLEGKDALLKEFSDVNNCISSILPSAVKIETQNKDTQKNISSTSFENEYPMSYGFQESGIVSHNVEHFSHSVTTNKTKSPEKYVEMTITLPRQDNGFGFRIVGGTEEGSQVSVGYIVPGGSADVDGRLRTGDIILGVNGLSVVNTSHQHVVQLMSNAAKNGKVTLHLRRNVFSEHQVGTKSLDNDFPFDVTVTRQENEGFGFVIISSVSKAGSTIGTIIPGSPADRCGQLHVGDSILAVNGVSILNMPHGDIVNLIKDSGYTVTLTVGHAHDDLSSTASVCEKAEETSFDHEEYYHSVQLHRGTKGFGFSIRGGKEFHNMPLFVLRIAENGPAHQNGNIQVGDEIIAINGISTKNMTHAEAIERIREGGNKVNLLVKRNSLVAPLVLNGQPSQSSPLSANKQNVPSNDTSNSIFEPNS